VGMVPLFDRGVERVEIGVQDRPLARPAFLPLHEHMFASFRAGRHPAAVIGLWDTRPSAGSRCITRPRSDVFG